MSERSHRYRWDVTVEGDVLKLSLSDRLFQRRKDWSFPFSSLGSDIPGALRFAALGLTTKAANTAQPLREDERYEAMVAIVDRFPSWPESSRGRETIVPDEDDLVRAVVEAVVAAGKAADQEKIRAWVKTTGPDRIKTDRPAIWRAAVAFATARRASAKEAEGLDF